MEKKDTIPLWLGAGITVVVSLPFGLWLGSWNLPLWISFIVWAEYFALGAKPEALKTIVPAFAAGVIAAAIVSMINVLVTKAIPDVKLVTTGDVATIVTFFVGFCVAVYVMKFIPFAQGPGSLPYLQGIGMMLAAYFTGQYATVFGNVDTVFIPLACGAGAILASLLGAFLGWFNVAILFPREVSGPVEATHVKV